MLAFYRINENHVEDDYPISYGTIIDFYMRNEVGDNCPISYGTMIDIGEMRFFINCNLPFRMAALAHPPRCRCIVLTSSIASRWRDYSNSILTRTSSCRLIRWRWRWSGDVELHTCVVLPAHHTRALCPCLSPGRRSTCVSDNLKVFKVSNQGLFRSRPECPTAWPATSE